MNHVLKSNKNTEFNTSIYENSINKLERYLNKIKFHISPAFNQWVKDFKLIYGPEITNLKLYCIYAAVYFVGHNFFNQFISPVNNTEKIEDNTLKRFNNIRELARKEFNETSVFELEYFEPLYNLPHSEETSDFLNLILSLSDYLVKLNILPEYLFDYLIQNIISPLIRHKSGEFYTPPFLVRKMIDESYKSGMKVLDPCCGSGNFLVEIVKRIIEGKLSEREKIDVINKIYGFDANPIAIFTAKLNLIFLCKNLSQKVRLNLYAIDSLFPPKELIEIKFDLIIGNPPWFTYRDIDTIDYQERVKKLAELLEIKPLPKNVLNIEIATIFFYRASDLFLQEGGTIFFVMTKGVITGSHAERFRSFKGFRNLNLWLFNKRIEVVFNIDFICLFAQKSEHDNTNKSIEISANIYALGDSASKVDYYGDAKIQVERSELYVPYSIEKKNSGEYVKKLVSKSELSEVISSEESYYKHLFHKGADLNPRNLIFVRVLNTKNSKATIVPDTRIFQKAKVPWNNKEYDKETVEKEYLFTVAKSTELVKFGLYDTYVVFLPLSFITLEFDSRALHPLAKTFYDKINSIFKSKKKETTKHADLMEGLNRWGKLINKRQLSPIKVVYNNSGSTLNAAVLQGSCLVTGDLSFYSTSDLNEAYYLTAILNSSVVGRQIEIKKSSRHIFKLPFEFPIEKYDPSKENHYKLSNLGKAGEITAKSTINELLRVKTSKSLKIAIQSSLKQSLSPLILEINEILKQELDSRFKK